MKLSELTWSLILILFKLNVNSEVSEMSTHETHRHRWKWYKQIKCAAFWTSVPQVKFKYATLCCPCRITLCVKRIALWFRGRIHFKSTPFSPPSLCLSITPPHAFSLRLSFFHSVLFSPPYFFSSRSTHPCPGLTTAGRAHEVSAQLRQRPCGSHLPITSVWFMSGLPQTQHSPHATAPSARLTIINLDPTLLGRTCTGTEARV